VSFLHSSQGTLPNPNLSPNPQATLRPLVELRRRDVDWATAVAEAEAAEADDVVEGEASGEGGYTVELHRLSHEEGEEAERRYGLTMGDEATTVSGVSERLAGATAVRVGHRVVAVGGIEVATAMEARVALKRIEKECEVMSAGLLGATLTLTDYCEGFSPRALFESTLNERIRSGKLPLEHFLDSSHAFLFTCSSVFVLRFHVCEDRIYLNPGEKFTSDWVSVEFTLRAPPPPKTSAQRKKKKARVEPPPPPHTLPAFWQVRTVLFTAAAQIVLAARGDIPELGRVTPTQPPTSRVGWWMLIAVNRAASQTNRPQYAYPS